MFNELELEKLSEEYTIYNSFPVESFYNFIILTTSRSKPNKILKWTDKNIEQTPYFECWIEQAKTQSAKLNYLI